MEAEKEDENGDGDGDSPFRGLVICVTGLSKEAREQVMEATERLGGTYTPTLHPKCTHLLVHSFRGRKLEHALNHGFRIGLFVVTVRWFVDSVALCARLHESPYSVCNPGKLGMEMGDWFTNSASDYDSCFPIRLNVLKKPSEKIGEMQRNSEGNFEVLKHSYLLGRSVYIDSDVSNELHSKVVDVAAQEGAVLLNQWFVGCGANYIVCEGSSIQKYLGHCDNIVSPIWFLKTSKERSVLRIVGLSADLARETGLMLKNLQEQDTNKENCHEHVLFSSQSRVSQAERLKIVKRAKCGIRNRRARRLQSCEGPLRPINSSTLLDSICWSISEPTSTVAVFEDSLLSKNVSGIQKHILFDGQERLESDSSFSNLLRPLTESERSELVFRDHFLTILFPVDRFAEMGPSSRTYFSDSGFTCLQLLEFIYDFYQESMSDNEIQVAIHTDSRHAESLRSMYCSDKSQVGLMYKRIQFLGSRKSFEKLKRVNGDNNSNVYELLIRE
ncbi:uncharacterized protein LOC141599649 isoform X2 [Silene latifolia]